MGLIACDHPASQQDTAIAGNSLRHRRDGGHVLGRHVRRGRAPVLRRDFLLGHAVQMRDLPELPLPLAPAILNGPAPQTNLQGRRIA